MKSQLPCCMLWLFFSFTQAACPAEVWNLEVALVCFSLNWLCYCVCSAAGGGKKKKGKKERQKEFLQAFTVSGAGE